MKKISSLFAAALGVAAAPALAMTLEITQESYEQARQNMEALCSPALTTTACADRANDFAAQSFTINIPGLTEQLRPGVNSDQEAETLVIDTVDRALGTVFSNPDSSCQKLDVLDIAYGAGSLGSIADCFGEITQQIILDRPETAGSAAFITIEQDMQSIRALAMPAP